MPRDLAKVEEDLKACLANRKSFVRADGMDADEAAISVLEYLFANPTVNSPVSSLFLRFLARERQRRLRLPILETSRRIE